MLHVLVPGCRKDATSVDALVHAQGHPTTRPIDHIHLRVSGRPLPGRQQLGVERGSELIVLPDDDVLELLGLQHLFQSGPPIVGRLQVGFAVRPPISHCNVQGLRVVLDEPVPRPADVHAHAGHHVQLGD